MFGKRFLTLMLTGALTVTSLVGCSNTSNSSSSQGGTQEITVLTNRTDIVDGRLKDYVAKFNETNPDIKVKFEAISDYAGEVKIRLNTSDYGDVLLIPDDLAKEEFANFFEPLGTLDELNEKYNTVSQKAYDGICYGLPTFVNTQGIVYNKALFKKAGITEVPKTPDEFIAAMKLIKEKTDAIPYYTNYADGWPLTQWEGNRTSVAGDENFAANLYKDEEPFAEGKAHYILYKLLYDLTKDGLIEQDPMTSNWETSKQMLADGEIGAMVLGSWAVTQIQALAEDPEDIGYMPFPYTQVDGTQYAYMGGDYNWAINKNSDKKEAARAFIDFMVDESGYAEDEGAIPTLKGKDLPESIKDLQQDYIKFIEDIPGSPEVDGLTEKVDNESEVGLWVDTFKKRIVEAGLGNTNESFDDIMNDLNSRWSKAVKTITQ